MAVKPVPDGYPSVTTYLIVRGAARAIDYYTKAFGGVELMRLDAPGGLIGHAEVRIGNTPVMLADENPEWGVKAPESLGGSPVHLLLYVEDCDAVFQARDRRRRHRSAADEGPILRRSIGHADRSVRPPVDGRVAQRRSDGRRDQAAGGGSGAGGAAGVRCLGCPVRRFGASRLTAGQSRRAEAHACGSANGRCWLSPSGWVAVALSAQRPRSSDDVKGYVRVNAPVMALTNVRVIDGTGAPARERQTIVIRDDRIAEVGDAARVTRARRRDRARPGRASVIPGLVMVHEHLYYPTGPGVYGQLGESFSRLYLAGGVTTMRTGGNMNGYMDLSLMRAIDAGQKAGPAIDATAPYVNGPNTFQQMTAVKTADEARRHVAYWAEQGATSVKAYMQISRAALGGAIEEAHKRGMKVTGHLCSVTYSEAADLGIDNLEHGFLAATDFVADKQPDVCPGQGRGQQTDRRARRERRAVQGAGEEADRQARRADVDAHGVRDVHAGTPAAARARGAHAAAEAAVRADATRASRRTRTRLYIQLFPKAMALERAFARAGGLLIAGTDPTGAGGVIPGFSNQRQIELLVDAGFTPLEAITIAHAERRALPRTRHRASEASRPASRPTWSCSTATRPRRSPTCGRSRSSSARASATTRRS